MPSRRTRELHAHRWSASGLRYFVTCCTHGRQQGLEQSPLTTSVVQAARSSDVLGDTTTSAFVVMPDHIHWLFALGARLALGRVVAKFKAQSKADLNLHGLSWQRDFYEHRLRSEESTEAYGLYIFLNPTRGGIAKAGEPWPGWWCPAPEQFEFMAHLDADGSFPKEWVAEPIPPGLAIGE